MERAVLMGEQIEIGSGDCRAVIAEQGATLESVQVAGVELVDSYDDAGFPGNACYGQILAPWPGRVEDGRYSFDDLSYQLPINDLDAHAAIHGLVRWSPWQIRERQPDRVALTYRCLAQPGYPFALELEQTYAWRAGALESRTTVTNLGATTAPYGYGSHVYFTVGSQRIDGDVLQAPGQRFYHADERLTPRLPSATVTGTPYDFLEPKVLGDLVLDTGYSHLRRDEDGWSRVRYQAPDRSRTIVIAMDPSIDYLQLYSGDTLPVGQRRGLAIEPYTCVANAFNNGDGLIRLEPGAPVSTVWTVSLE
jgi:aldose 1-epimerase